MSEQTIQIHRVFIANRGEIARRIAQTCRLMGIQTATISDRKTPPGFLVDWIDCFYPIPEETTAVYLNPEAMIKAAVATGCDAVHPGFGFLSENAGFAKAVTAAGLVWIGPQPEAIEKMASKAAARDIAMDSKVPCIEGLQNFDVKKDAKKVADFARKVGYPVLIKAAMGGGGKGMRIVWQESELAEACQRAASEALNSFGDEALIVEKYIETPRHVEVQVLADQYGHVAIIGDRDCSVQRRHQKILEEAPAPDLSEDVRKSMHKAAKDLAEKVGYSSAGTVEFLVDWSPKSREKGDVAFFFLEMNTRLQVEHPVTEEVYGLDLVEWQLRIAQGEKLAGHIKKLKQNGHAIEARIYAEDCENEYMPSPGPVLGFEPANVLGTRWEVGLDSVDRISQRFDPMVAKLIVHAPNRKEAIARMATTLQQTFFPGSITNIEFLRTICGHSQFAEEVVGTNFLSENSVGLCEVMKTQRVQAKPHADRLLNFLETLPVKSVRSHSHVIENKAVEVFHKGSSSKNAGFTILQETESVVPGLGSIRRGRISFSKEAWFAICLGAEATDYWVFLDGWHFSRRVEAPSLVAGGSSAASDLSIQSPVPGKVIDIRVEEGKAVQKGDSLIVVESMKMEFQIKADRDATLGSILVVKDAQVAAGQELAVWAAD